MLADFQLKFKILKIRFYLKEVILSVYDTKQF